MNRKFIKIAHRGASGDEPENTLRAFSRAIELGVDMVELDVHLCQSGELVVIHDERLDRTTNGRGPVSEMTLDQLKRLDAGKGEQVPLLEEVIDLIDKRCAINVELKGMGTALPAVDLVYKSTREKACLKDDFILSSFSREELIAARKADPDIRLGLNISGLKESFSAFARDLRLFSIHPGADITSKELIERIHRLDLKAFVWTVDDVERIRLLKSFGVDGIFSNYPDRL